MSQFLKLPGYWIDGENRDAASNTYLFLEFAIGAFNEAVVAQRAFESCYSRFVRDKSAARSQRVARVDDLKRLIFSKAFVFALDELRQLLDVMTKECELSEAAETMCREFLEEYEVVRRVRNSLHHVEDRVRGRGPYGRRLETPILALAVTTNRRFGATTERNCLEEIPITSEFLNEVRNRLLDLIWTFPWLGPGNLRVERRG